MAIYSNEQNMLLFFSLGPACEIKTYKVKDEVNMMVLTRIN